MKKNLYDDVPSSLTEEHFTDLLKKPGMRLERIVSQGQTTPENDWYDQAMSEWVLVLKGAARLQFQDPSETIELASGDYVLIPAHRRHRVEWTDPERQTVWLALFFDGDGSNGL